MTDERRSTPRTSALHAELTRQSALPGWIVGKAYVEMREHAERIEREKAATEREIAGLRAAIQSAHDELMNMQPHIESCCLPRMAPIIDAHVDVAMETLSKALAGEAGNTSNEL